MGSFSAGLGHHTVTGSASGDTITGTNGGEIIRASTSAAGGQANGASSAPVLTADGSKILFISAASNLVVADTNNAADLFLKDLITGEITRVSSTSLDPNFGQENNAALSGVLSANGQWLGYLTQATNVVGADLNHGPDLFLRDMSNAVTTRLSASASGVAANGTVGSYMFSDDLRKVIFTSDATNLIDGQTTSQAGLYLKDTQTGAISLIATGVGYQPAISADGTKVAFATGAALLPGDTNGTGFDIYVKDLSSGVLTLVTTNSAGAQVGGGYLARFSPDGSKLVLTSGSSGYVAGDTNNVLDIFLKDLVSGAVSLVSSNAAGQIGAGSPQNPDSTEPRFSGDGRFIAFESDAANLAPGDTHQLTNVFIKNLATGGVIWASTATNGTPGDGYSVHPSLSGDGGEIAFISGAENLAAGDTNGAYDIYVKDLGADTLSGGDGADQISGLGGDDLIYGGAGDDQIDAGDGNDTADGEGGNDNISGGAGDDILRGGVGFDVLSGGDGKDILYGGADGNSLYGGAGDDALYGGAFDENGVRFSGYGSSFLYGGAGNNTLYGGGTHFSLAFASYSSAATVDLAAGTGVGAGFSDTLIGVNHASGSSFADSLTGNSAANSLWGNGGDDTLAGADGDDLMMGDDGADTLYGGAGNDVLDSGMGTWADSLFGGGGHDIARYMAITAAAATWTHNANGTWTVNDGSAGADTLTGVEVLKFSDRLVVIRQDTASDFNADGKSDVLWRNDSGEIYVWNSQAGQGAFLGQTLGNPGTGWHVQNVGDYDGDGKADILWRNNAGDIYVYRSDDGAGVSFTGQSISYVDPVWAIVPHAGDFNGDGRSDILFRNTATGEVYLWDSRPVDADPLSDDPVQFLGQTLGTVAQSWQIQGADDFNADGRTDVLWRNEAGDVYVWLATGSGYNVGVTGQSISFVPNDWTLLGTGDFNGDGRADILWRHAGDGELYVWNSQPSLSAVNFLGQSVGAVSLDWTVAAIGDYDGDGRADVLFRNTDGRVYLWNSEDTGPVGFVGQGLGTTATDWHILSDFHVM